MISALGEQTRAGFDALDRRFDAVDRRFDAVDAGFDAVGAGFDGVRGRLDGLAAGQQTVVRMLTTLIDRDDGDVTDR